MTLADFKKTRTELVDQTLLLMDDPLGERWAASRVPEALNDAVLDFCMKTQVIKAEINIVLKTNIHEYDIKTQVEEDGTLRLYGFPIRVGFNGNGDPGMWPTTLLTIDLMGSSQTANASPMQWHLDSVSPGKIVLFGPPAADGTASPSESGNMQVTYIGLPNYMDDDGDYPDAHIPVASYETIPYGAAAMLLEEGDGDDLAKSIEYEALFRRGTLAAVAEDYRSNTVYDDARPA
ncbi:hypothetical protein LCGC14_0384520 [marine sediment metagenome]|uniref:Uncharacterized protein n=1 Tax=marine sediment metagenome TaxID=412755 RepID=A0A0F9WAB9_9ZZZZ